MLEGIVTSEEARLALRYAAKDVERVVDVVNLLGAETAQHIHDMLVREPEAKAEAGDEVGVGQA